MTHPIFNLGDRLRSAARTGRGLRLGPEHVEILMSANIYDAIAAFEAEEIRRACEARTANDNSWANSGSGNTLKSAPGASAGSNRSTVEVSRGASLLLQEAAIQTLRHKKRSTH